jgi:hypothetical protein
MAYSLELGHKLFAGMEQDSLFLPLFAAAYKYAALIARKQAFWNENSLLMVTLIIR